MALSFAPPSKLAVREHIPLEQGLRRNGRRWTGCSNDRCQRAYSIRTRIKTQNSTLSKPFDLAVREHIPLEQGLRRIFLISSMIASGLSESIFH